MPSGPLTPQNMGEMVWKTNGTGWFLVILSRLSGILSNFLASKKTNQLKTTKSKCIISSCIFLRSQQTNPGERLHPAWHRYLFHQHGGNAAGTLELETGVGLVFRWSFGASTARLGSLFFEAKGIRNIFWPFFMVSLMLFCSAVSVSQKNAGVNMSDMQKDWGENIRTAIMEQTHLLDPIFFELHTLALRKATSWAGHGPKTDGVK